jgi:hypothetical protein
MSAWSTGRRLPDVVSHWVDGVVRSSAAVVEHELPPRRLERRHPKADPRPEVAGVVPSAELEVTP